MLEEDPPIARPERINVNELHELHDWAEYLRVGADRLREIVKRVGDRPDDVEQYLRTVNG